jgi:hypothetical protein
VIGYPPMQLRTFRVIVLCLLPLLATGCMAGHPGTKKSAPPPAEGKPGSLQQPGGSDLEAYERDLLASEQRLNELLEQQRQQRLASGQEEAPAGVAQEPRAEAPAPPAAPEPAPAPVTAPAEKPAEELAAAPTEDEAAPPHRPRGPACELSCRALASMRRASAGICGLVGHDDARCLRAQQKVKQAAARVANAGCSCPE